MTQYKTWRVQTNGAGQAVAGQRGVGGPGPGPGAWIIVCSAYRIITDDSSGDELHDIASSTLRVRGERNMLTELCEKDRNMLCEDEGVRDRRRGERDGTIFTESETEGAGRQWYRTTQTGTDA